MIALMNISQTVQAIPWAKTHLPSDGDVWFDCGEDACACCASLSTFLDESLNEGFFLVDFDLLARCLEKLPSWCRVRPDENMVNGSRTVLSLNKGILVDAA